MPLLADIDLSEITNTDCRLGGLEGYWFKTIWTSVILPSSVTFIGWRSFYGCSGLTNFTIPPKVTNIESSTFQGCSGLKSITIPSSVENIYINAFDECTGLTSIYSFRNTPPKVYVYDYPTPSGGFFCKLDKTKCILFVPYLSTALYAAASGWSEFKNIVEIPGIFPSENALEIGAEQGSTVSTNISSNVIWTVNSDKTWLTINPASGTGEKTLTFTAEANSSDTSRTATLTVSAPGVDTQTITVKQWASTTDVNDLDENSKDFTCYPNPFNSVTTISWQLSKTSKVTLQVLDIVGRTVAMLVDEQQPQGKYENQFNAGTLPKGIYFCQLKAGEFSQTRKIILME